VVFGGHCLIAENGTLLAESPRFLRRPNLLVADVDLDRLRADRIRTNSFGDASLYVGPRPDFARVEFSLGERPLPGGLRRAFEAHPSEGPGRLRVGG
jgi:NAD+ synthase (glutamine-hydrolysing)